LLNARNLYFWLSRKWERLSYSDHIDKGKAQELGIASLIYKPIVKAELAKTVWKVLDEVKTDS